MNRSPNSSPSYILWAHSLAKTHSTSNPRNPTSCIPTTLSSIINHWLLKAHFPKKNVNALNPIHPSFVYLDDVLLVAFSSDSKHVEHLESVEERPFEAGLVFNVEEFFQLQVKILSGKLCYLQKQSKRLRPPSKNTFGIRSTWCTPSRTRRCLRHRSSSSLAGE